MKYIKVYCDKFDISYSYTLRLKEYERERRLLERQKRIQQAAAA